MNAPALRPLGNTGLEVTVLGFGGAPIGGFRKSIPEETARNTVREAYDAGVKLFDTSPYYGYGRSEHLCGRVLQDMARDSYLISTKVGRCLYPLRPGESREGLLPGGLRFRPQFDYSYDGAMRSYEQSLARLGVGLVDILLIHDVDAVHPRIRGKRMALVRDRQWKVPIVRCANCVRSGDVKAIGVGSGRCSVVQAGFWTPPTSTACWLPAKYTLLDQSCAAWTVAAGMRCKTERWRDPGRTVQFRDTCNRA